MCVCIRQCKVKHGGKVELWALPIVKYGYLKLHITQLRDKEWVCVYMCEHMHPKFFGNKQTEMNGRKSSGESEWDCKNKGQWKREREQEWGEWNWRGNRGRSRLVSTGMWKRRSRPLCLSFNMMCKHTSHLYSYFLSWRETGWKTGYCPRGQYQLFVQLAWHWCHCHQREEEIEEEKKRGREGERRRKEVSGREHTVTVNSNFKTLSSAAFYFHLPLRSGHSLNPETVLLSWR